MSKKRFMNKKTEFPVSEQGVLAKGIEFVEEALEELSVPKKQALRIQLAVEELLSTLIQNSSPDAVIKIQVKKYLSDATVRIQAAGKEFILYESLAEETETIDEMADDKAESAIRSVLLRSFGNDLKLSHKNGINQAQITVRQSGSSTVIWTLCALVLGLLFGAILKNLIPTVVSDGISTYVLHPIQTMFMNALKIIIGPVVFFSIVTCISQFSDLAELGRIAGKVMGMYLFTTVIAVLLAIGISSLIRPGQFGFALSFAGEISSISVDTDVDTSLLTTIVNIIPNNIVKPFLESDTLQIIFLGVLLGVAVGKIGKYAPILQDFFEACNSLFLTVTTMIAKLIPVIVFCSSALILVEMGGESILSVLGYFGTNILAVICMMVIYGLLILILARLNPLTFFKKNREGMLTSFTLCSSSAAMPTNLRTCTDKLGISPKVCNFSIPLGATVNMDGTCIFLVTAGLFLARAYAINVSWSALASLAITIILLSLGCPGVPGSGIVCLGIVLTNLGVPIDAIGLIMGVTSFVDMFNTTSNTTGDVAASLIVAKSEKLVNTDVYYSKG